MISPLFCAVCAGFFGSSVTMPYAVLALALEFLSSIYFALFSLRRNRKLRTARPLRSPSTLRLDSTRPSSCATVFGRQL